MNKLVVLVVMVLISAMAGNAQDMLKLDRDQAGRMARLAFRCIHTEYANNLSHSMQSVKDVGTPSQLHPVFYGCYDWHSSVHGH